MISGIRPLKHPVEKKLARKNTTNFDVQYSLDEICDLLKITPDQRDGLDHDNERPIDGHLLRINVSGISYSLQRSTVLRRSVDCLLSQLIHASTHAERLQYCHGYIEKTDEYYYERSPYLFETIVLQCIINGVSHKPENICLEVYIGELSFWRIKQAAFGQCCLDPEMLIDPDEVDLMNQTALSVTKDAFYYLKCGSLRRYVFNLLEVPESSTSARVFGCFSLFAVLFATAIMVAASIPELQIPHNETLDVNGVNHTVTMMIPHPILDYTETICIIWFTLEYLTKILVAANRRQTACHLLNLIDLIAIVPFYVELVISATGVNLGRDFKGAFLMMRVLRVSRVIRIFKLGRYSSGLRAFACTLRRSMKQLSMLAVVLTTGVMFFSTLVYNLEKDAPDTKFKSIPDAFWWCIVTMTTVGYGDMYPTTTLGKLVGSGAIACGVLVLALPITIIVDNFMQVHELKWAEQQAQPTLSSGLATLATKQARFAAKVAGVGKATNSPDMEPQEQASPESISIERF